MVKGFYLRLAAGNLWRNRRMYGPYAVATALISGMFFIIINLIYSRSVRNLSYGATMMVMFTIGIGVMTIFTVGYMLYINSFLIKRRKKEFGLYGVLGMERRHVTRVVLWENAMLGLGALALGLGGGMVFGRLVFLILMNVLDTAQGSVYTLSGSALLSTALIFCGIFLLTTLYNLRQVRLASPIDLLKGGQKGEKAVRFPIIWTVLGALMLGYAYYLAISVRNSAVALMEFWPAVILVIIATWLLFTGGSVFILGRMKATKRLYYTPRNFITISGLIHRMKQNAAGLANICILSTMVMVTVSCCCALYLGQEVILSEQMPSDIRMTLRYEDKAVQADVTEQLLEQVAPVAAAHGVTVDQLDTYRFVEYNVLYTDGHLQYADENGTLAFSIDMPSTAYYAIDIVLAEDFTALTGMEADLGADEALLLVSGDTATFDSIPLKEGALTVKAVHRDTLFTRQKNADLSEQLFVVVRDQAVADALATAINPSVEAANLRTAIHLNAEAGMEQGLAFSRALKDTFITLCRETATATDEAATYRFDSIFENRIDSMSMYGGLLFLGVFFSLLFLINTALILYFKQISEGFDDSERFAILQKVGLSDQEVRSTINRQMLIVFLLPLLAALLHILAASNMIRQMLGTFMLTDFALVMRCILVTAVIFIAVYLVMYRLTARTYYRLVKW